MKIVARVKGEDQALVAYLAGRNIEARLVRNGVIIDLPYAHQKGFEVPDELCDATLLINVAEEGGAMTKTGSATVVCGLSGKALRPYRVPHGGHLANGEHAFFSVPDAVITVMGYRSSGKVVIEEHRIVRDGRFAHIKTKMMWSGHIGDLPEMYDRFAVAALAANVKTNCYHCRHCHYIAEAK